MTQAFNLAQLANNLNTSGQLDATDGLSGLVTNANLASSGTASASTFLRGDRTWGSVPRNFVQCVQNLTNDYTLINAGGTAQIVTVTVTPTSSSSRFLLMLYTSLGWYDGSPNTRMFARRAISGGSTTDLGSFTLGTRKGGLSGLEVIPENEWLGSMSAQYIDQPATTSDVTYGVVIGTEDGSTRVNRVGSDADAVWATRTYTGITVMEFVP